MFTKTFAKYTGIYCFLLYYLGTINLIAQPYYFEQNYKQARYFQNIDTDSALYYGRLAYLEATKNSKTNLQLDALVLLIKTRIKKGEYSTAFKICLQADSIAHLNAQHLRNIEISMYKGLVYTNSGLSAEGLKIYFEVKELINKSGDKTFEGELDYYIALAYFNIGEIKKCKTYLLKANKAEKAVNNNENTFKSLVVLTRLFQQRDSVLKYLQLAENSISMDSNDYKKSVLLSNKAQFYKSAGNFTESKKSYLRAISISLKHGFNKQLASQYNNFAYLLMSESKYDSAFLYLNKALNLSKRMNNIDLEASFQDSFSDYYSAIGDSANALTAYKQSVKLRNKFRKQQQIEESLLLSTVFETEKKEREIIRKSTQLYRTKTYLFIAILMLTVATVLFILFRQKSAIRKAQITTIEQEKKLEVANALIKGQDSERKHLAMNLHDGVAPKLGSLRLMVDKHFENSEGYDKVCATIKDIDVNIRRISHRMLPPQLERRGLVVALEQFVNSLQDENSVSIRLFAKLKQRLDEQYETSLFFVFYELLHNAIKHAGATEITVQLLDDSKVLSCSVEDNGKGFDPFISHQGIGLKNVHQRVKHLNGTMTIDSSFGVGTAILIEITKNDSESAKVSI